MNPSGKTKPGPGSKERKQPKPFLQSGVNKPVKREQAPTKKAGVTRNTANQREKL